MSDLGSLFEHQLDLDPAGDLDARTLELPPAWAVYLLADADDRPVQLLCVKNLRASVRRRLDPDAGSDRRADLSGVVRRVAYTLVDSDFEQDLRYLEAARACFPESYAGVLGFSPAWFVHFNPETKYPRLTRQNQVDKKTGLYVGPLPDKHAADRLIRAVEDAFDLCRDRERLLSDKSEPCQWRQMGKCVGPCEGPPGGVSLDAYRALCVAAAEALADPPAAAAATRDRMLAAASEQRFEVAGQLKAHADNLAALREKNNRLAGPVEDMRYLAVLPGGDGAAKLFACRAGQVTFLAAVFKGGHEAILPVATSMLAEPAERPFDTGAFETASLVSAHLFAPKNRPGDFLHARELTSRALAAAVRKAATAIRKTATGKREAADATDEGEVRGLQSLG